MAIRDNDSSIFVTCFDTYIKKFFAFAAGYKSLQHNGQKKVDKSPFKLRRRRLADGRESLFIDYTAAGKHEYAFLSLYLVPETSVKAKRENARTLRQAEEIVLAETEAWVNGKTQAEAAKDKSKTLLADFMDLLIAEYKGQSRSGYANLRTAKGVLLSFRPDCRLCDIDKRFCTDYADRLKGGYLTKDGKPIEKATAFSYFWQLGIVLTNAWQKGYIKRNPWKLLGRHEKIQRPESRREYLTLEEVQKLEHTPYKRAAIRQAFLFACYCGLRISDIMDLRWRSISVNGGRWYVSVVMHKNSKPLSLPLPAKALQWLPERGEADSSVFNLPSPPCMRRYIKKWAAQAGINHDICFHTSRHTYGTMLITAGVDLYTASKMMGHADVRPTQEYAKIADRKKEEAVGMVDKMFEKKEIQEG